MSSLPTQTGRRFQFSLRQAFSWLTVVALWLGAVQGARFAELRVGGALVIAAVLTACWFRRSLPSWMAWVVAIMGCVGISYLLMPEIY
jgi:hypothetical protein